MIFSRPRRGLLPCLPRLMADRVSFCDDLPEIVRYFPQFLLPLRRLLRVFLPEAALCGDFMSPILVLPGYMFRSLSPPHRERSFPFAKSYLLYNI